MNPSLRRPLGILAIFAGVLVYATIVVAFFGRIVLLNPLLQLPIWAFLGTIWVLPLKPLVYWIETGKWRPEKPDRGA